MENILNTPAPAGYRPAKVEDEAPRFQIFAAGRLHARAVLRDNEHEIDYPFGSSTEARMAAKHITARKNASQDFLQSLFFGSPAKDDAYMLGDLLEDVTL